MSFSDIAREFQAEWDRPGNTRFELPAVDVNRVLAERYVTARPFRMTLAELWDMEVKKAWDPRSYIPYVVSDGYSWGRAWLTPKTERFCRASMQAGWIAEGRGQVLEEVLTDHDQLRIFFMGRQAFTTDTGEQRVASDYQPLFHVEHAAGGTPSDPVNIWRIVFLTAQEDQRLKAPFEAMAAAGLLPGFVEIYIEQDLGVGLQRRAAGAGA